MKLRSVKDHDALQAESRLLQSCNLAHYWLKKINK